MSLPVNVQPIDPSHHSGRISQSCRCPGVVVANVLGLGYKEASHFLRTLGLGEDLAILDRHILKNLALLGVIDKVPESPTKRRYFEIERQMTAFSSQAGIPMGSLIYCSGTRKRRDIQVIKYPWDSRESLCLLSIWSGNRLKSR